MKKTFNINLGGYPFIIDEDAYNLLKDYLDTIRYAFDTKDDTGELASDIESRIAELLLQRENGQVKIITFDEISKVIERIGRPSEFIEIEEDYTHEESTNRTSSSNSRPNGRRQTTKGDVAEEEELWMTEEKLTPPPYIPNQPYSRNPFVRKKMFRDPQNALLGGVCNGLAYYLNIDQTIVRIIAVVLLLLSVSTVAIIYIVLWIVLPPANTPLERMQMKGEDPTMENIGKTVTETFREEEARPHPENSDKNKGFLSSMISVIVKCLIILGFLVAAPVLIALSATLIACVIAAFIIGIGIVGGGMFDSVNEGLMVLYILFAVIGGAITLGVPVWLLIQKLMKKKETHTSPSTQRAILIIWLCGIALVSIFTVKAVRKGHQLDRTNWGENILRLQDLNELDPDEIENFHISNGNIIITTDDGTTYKIKNGKVTMQTDSISENIIENDSIPSDTLATEIMTESSETIESTESGR